MLSRPSLAVLFALLGAAPLPAAGFVRSEVPDEPGHYQFWADRAVELRPSAEPGAGIAPEALRVALERSAAVWSAPECTDLVVSVGDDATGTDSNLVGDGLPDFENRVVWRADWPEDLGTDVAAITTLLVEVPSGAIVDADVDLNEAGFAWSMADDDPDAIDLESNLTHELGHVIGFDHTRDDQATMYYSTRPGDLSRRDLAETDAAGVCFVYPAGAATPAGTVEEEEPDDDDGGGCGCAVPPGGRTDPLGALLFLAALASRRRG